MNGLWDILSVAIGVSFVFMILSILNSWIQDYVATILNIRANNLADIMQVLLDPGALKLNGKKMALAQPPENNEFTISERKKRPTKHEVEKYNETFVDLAKQYGVTINDLQNANPDTIEKLVLPAKTKLNIEQNFSKVQDGDTLSKIAREYKVSIDNLRKANPEVVSKLLLPVGAKLTIPVTYIAKKDEKLSEIAKNNNVSNDEIQEANTEVLNELLKKVNTPESSDASNQPGEKSPDTASSAKALGMLENVAEKAREVVSPLISNPNAKALDNLTLPAGTKLTIPVMYTVKDGDTLSKIAKEYKDDVSVDSLQNEVPLQVGTEITIPEIVYAAGEDETLKKIVEKGYKVSIDDLRRANLEVINTLALPLNSKLTIPDPKADRHKVEGEDETMNKIALARGVSYADLQKANPDRKEGPDAHLEQGITLKIPKPEIGQMVSRRNVLPQLSANPVGSLYRHPIIHSLSKPGELPDRIPTKDFTVALLDLLDDIGRGDQGKKPSDVINIETIKEGIKNLEGDVNNENIHPLAFRLRSLLHTAQINTQINNKKDKVDASLEEFQKAVSEWFDDTVARGSIWYKRRMQRIGIIFGILLAVVLNADTIGISNALWHNAVLRESISQAAEATTQQGETPDTEQAQAQLDELMSLGLPIGWTFDGNQDDPRAIPNTTGGWIAKSIGLLLTGFAISQGSQLWFDLINRLINIRSTVSKSDTDEASSKNKA